MTTIVANAELNMNTFDLGSALDYLFSTLTPSAAVYFDDADTYQAFTGSGLDYNASGDWTDGTVTGAETVDGGTSIFQYSDFSILATALYQLIQDNDPETMFNTILAGDDTITGSAFKDVILANTGDDTVFGNAGNDVLQGGSGFDKLSGGDGYDKIYGGAGGDTIDGQNGTDTLTGGVGKDKFVFSTKLKATNIDTIKDFSVIDDTIQLSSSIFTKAGPVGQLNTWRFVTGPEATDSLDRIIYDDATGALYYDSDGDGAAAAVQFAQLSTGLTLTSADFQVI